jgi:hypothetical protein
MIPTAALTLRAAHSSVTWVWRVVLQAGAHLVHICTIRSFLGASINTGGLLGPIPVLAAPAGLVRRKRARTTKSRHGSCEPVCAPAEERSACIPVASVWPQRPGMPQLGVRFPPPSTSPRASLGPAGVSDVPWSPRKQILVEADSPSDSGRCDDAAVSLLSDELCSSESPLSQDFRCDDGHRSTSMPAAASLDEGSALSDSITTGTSGMFVSCAACMCMIWVLILPKQCVRAWSQRSGTAARESLLHHRPGGRRLRFTLAAAPILLTLLSQ